MKKNICLIIFIVYVLVVLRLTVFRVATLEEHQLNLKLFTYLVKLFRTNTFRFLIQFFGNIGWFVPFGFLLPIIVKKERFVAVLIGGFCFSFVIEILQLVLKKGYCELDDLILNTLGTTIGYLMYKLLIKLSKKNCVSLS